MLENTRVARRIIYVDASFCNETKESKICLYDVESNRIDTLMTKMPTSSAFSERYAIVYACLYAKKFNLLDNKVHILNDNYTATTDTKIQDLCTMMHVSVSWIPREINQIADDGTRKNSNVNVEDVNIYDLFYELMIEKATSDKDVDDTKQTNTHSNEKNILLNAFRHSKVANKPYVGLGQIGKYLKENNPSFTYASLKKVLEKYPKDFTIVNKDYVKLFYS